MSNSPTASGQSLPPNRADQPRFDYKVDAWLASHQGLTVLELAPRLDRLPFHIQRYDDPVLPLCREIIDASSHAVAGYWLDMAAFLATGAAGIRALERTLAYIPHGHIRILHGPFVGAGYADMAAPHIFDLDAITVTEAADEQFYRQHFPYTAIRAATDSSAISVRLNERTITMTRLDSSLYHGLYGDDFQQQIGLRPDSTGTTDCCCSCRAPIVSGTDGWTEAASEEEQLVLALHDAGPGPGQVCLQMQIPRPSQRMLQPSA